MRVRVWDLPTRLFHWGLVATFAGALLTGDEPSRGALHVAAGTAATGLLLFRLGWGFVGERWSRWSALGQEPGHTRKASVSVLAALAGIGLLGATGLVVLGGEELRGPLAGLTSIELGVSVHAVHRALAWGLVAWVGVHLAGIALESRASGQNLIRGMLDGRKRHEGAAVRTRSGAAAALAAGVTAVGVYLTLAPRPSVGPALARDAGWDEACGECHLAYPPSLLPAASWSRMLAADQHFGEWLGLDAAQVGALGAFAAQHAAEAGETEHAVRIAAERFTGDRVTETALWASVHAEIPAGVFEREEVGGRIRCAACHSDAEDGVFDGRAAEIPAPADQRLAERQP